MAQHFRNRKVETQLLMNQSTNITEIEKAVRGLKDELARYRAEISEDGAKIREAFGPAAPYSTGKEICQQVSVSPGRAAITSAATWESYAFHSETLPESYRSQTAAGSSAVPESRCTSGSCVAHATDDTEHRCQTPPAIEGFWRS